MDEPGSQHLMLLAPARQSTSWRSAATSASTQLDRYVELELRRRSTPTQRVPGLRAHLVGCPACAEEHESLRALLELDSVS